MRYVRRNSDLYNTQKVSGYPPDSADICTALYQPMIDIYTHQGMPMTSLHKHTCTRMQYHIQVECHRFKYMYVYQIHAECHGFQCSSLISELCCALPWESQR